MSNRKGLWHNIRKNRGSGKKPTAEMLKQEKKIKANTGKGKKYPDGKGKKITGYAYPNQEELGIGGELNYGDTSVSGDLSKYYKNLKINQNIPINKNLNLNLGLESGNISKYQNFQPGFNVGITKKFPDGKGGEKKIVYVEDPKEFKLQQDARTDSTNSATEALQLKAKMEQQSLDYETSVKKLDSMTDDEYDEYGDDEETKGNTIAKNSMDTRNKIKSLETKYNGKKIEPSSRVKSKFLGSDQFVPNYSFPKTTVELKKKEEKKKVELLNFEKRIQDPSKSIDNKDGSSSTHKMLSYEANGKFYAAPTVVEIDGELVELTPNEAVDYAMKNKQYKEFSSEKEAQDYSEGGYKKGTPLEEPEEKEFKNKDHTGKIKYITDGYGVTQYFFINSDGTQYAMDKNAALSKRDNEGVEIIDLYKEKGTNKMKKVKKKMPMGIKYNSGRKGQYTYGKKKYMSGLLGTIGKSVAGSLGGSKFGATGTAGKIGNVLGDAANVAGFIASNKHGGDEKAEKVAAGLTAGAGIANTIQGAQNKQVEKRGEILSAATGTPNVIPKTGGDGESSGNTFDENTGTIKKKEGYKKGLKPNTMKNKMTTKETSLFGNKQYVGGKSGNAGIKKVVSKMKAKSKKKKFDKEYAKQKATAEKDTADFEKANPSDKNMTFSAGKKGGKGVSVKRRNVKEYR